MKYHKETEQKPPLVHHIKIYNEIETTTYAHTIYQFIFPIT